MNNTLEDICFMISLLCMVLIITVIGLTMVMRNREYCEIEENKKEWNCLTHKDIWKGNKNE